MFLPILLQSGFFLAILNDLSYSFITAPKLLIFCVIHPVYLTLFILSRLGMGSQFTAIVCRSSCGTGTDVQYHEYRSG